MWYDKSWKVLWADKERKLVLVWLQCVFASGTLSLLLSNTLFSVTFVSLQVDSNIFQFYFITQSIQEERTVCMRWEIFGKLLWAMKGSLSSEVLHLPLSKILFSVFIGSPWVHRNLISVCAYCLLLNQKKKKKKRWRQLWTLLDYLEILIFLLFQNILINSTANFLQITRIEYRSRNVHSLWCGY